MRITSQSAILFFQDEALTGGKPAVQIDYRTESAALKIQYFVRRWLYRKDMGQSGQWTRSLLQHKITESRYCNAIWRKMSDRWNHIFLTISMFHMAQGQPVAARHRDLAIPQQSADIFAGWNDGSIPKSSDPVCTLQPVRDATQDQYAPDDIKAWTGEYRLLISYNLLTYMRVFHSLL